MSNVDAFVHSDSRSDTNDSSLVVSNDFQHAKDTFDTLRSICVHEWTVMPKHPFTHPLFVDPSCDHPLTPDAWNGFCQYVESFSGWKAQHQWSKDSKMYSTHVTYTPPSPSATFPQADVTEHVTVHKEPADNSNTKKPAAKKRRLADSTNANQPTDIAENTTKTQSAAAVTTMPTFPLFIAPSSAFVPTDVAPQAVTRPEGKKYIELYSALMNHPALPSAFHPTVSYSTTVEPASTKPTQPCITVKATTLENERMTSTISMGPYANLPQYANYGYGTVVCFVHNNEVEKGLVVACQDGTVTVSTGPGHRLQLPIGQVALWKALKKT